ncbi:MAG: DUF5678 domain-containing protein [Chloroflexota bacterium]
MKPTALRKKIHQQIDKLPEQVLEEIYSITSQYVEPTWREIIDRHLAEETDPKELAMWREESAFLELHEELKVKYMGQHVAMKDGKIVDHDSDVASLYKRVRQKFEGEFVLIDRVQEDPVPIIKVRSPRIIQ